jgi:hypothetical protein
LPSVLHLTLSDLGGCATMAGSYPMFWNGGSGWVASPGSVGGFPLTAFLRCMGSDCSGFQLTLNACGITYANRNPLSCDCSPNLQFGNYRGDPGGSGTGCCNGTFSAVVTL